MYNAVARRVPCGNDFRDGIEEQGKGGGGLYYWDRVRYLVLKIETDTDNSLSLSRYSTGLVTQT